MSNLFRTTIGSIRWRKKASQSNGGGDAFDSSRSVDEDKGQFDETIVSDAKLRFTIEAKTATDSSYKQWVDAMRMVVRLPGGIPPEFRRKGKIESCFSDRANPDDESLGEQIIKDLHRTGCDLFSGADASVNQALLKQVLLAFARWNKSVGYCQGFNILAAVILEVVEWKVEEALMVMIFLIEGLLPESYFANNLRGLSVDMAVFRDLMKIHLNDLSNHLDHLQYSSLEGVACYEPPLINVFTLQWFLTLFSNCLPKSLVLRIWDLIFLEGSEILLRTALIIWSNLSSQIYSVKSADEFYSIMGVLMMQLMEYTTTDGNKLITDIINLADFPYVKVNELREKYTYHIRPLSSNCNSPSSGTGGTSNSGSNSPFSFVKKGLHLLPFTSSSDEDDINSNEHFEFFFHQDQLISSLPRPGSPCVNSTADGSAVPGGSKSRSINSNASGTMSPDRMSLDVSLLRKQYVKLCQRQKQAHLILTEGLRYGYSSTFNRSSSSDKQSAKDTGAGKKSHDSTTINSLLSGKPALTVKTSSKPPMVALPTTEGKSKHADATRPHNSGAKKSDAEKKPKDKSSHRSSVSASAVTSKKSESDSSKNKSSSNNSKETNDVSNGKADRSSKCQPANNVNENAKRSNVTSSSSGPSMSSSVHQHDKAPSKTKSKQERSDVDRINITESSNESQDDETITSDETSEEVKAKRVSSNSSSTSINNSLSSSSSNASHASSVSTVDTVVMKKRKKSDESAANGNGQGKRDASGESAAESNSCKSKSNIVVVRRRFGPNVRRASSILEQSSFSVDEPDEGDDESTSSSEDDDKGASGSQDNNSPGNTVNNCSGKGVSGKRKDFSRRHQNTITLTWSEIRKIRKTSAPAAVIRSSLSSPPTDLSPCNDDEPGSPALDEQEDTLTDNSCENSNNEDNQQVEKIKCQQETIEQVEDKCTVTCSPTREKIEEKVNVTENNGHQRDSGESAASIRLNDSPVASTELTVEMTDCSTVTSLPEPLNHTSETGGHESSHEVCDKVTSKITSPRESVKLMASVSTEKSDTTMGPDDEETECENDSEWELDTPPIVLHAKNLLETLPLDGPTETRNITGAETQFEVENGGDTGKDDADGDERITKSVQSEISNLTIEECLARLSARISTLNSEMQ